MKKNIAYIHSVAEIGGAERMTEALILGLDKKLYTPHLVCPENGPFTKQIASLGYNTHTTNFFNPNWKSPIKTYMAKKQWKKLFIENNISLIHTGDLDCARSCLLAANSLNIPVICHVHFPFPEVYAKWVFRNLPKPSAFIFCSQELQDDVGPLLDTTCPKAKQKVVHNGVDIHSFTPKETQNKVPKVGIISNLQQRKGHEDFLDMASLLNKENQTAHYEIIGGDILKEPRQSLLEEYANKLELSEQVTFHGQVSNVKELLSELDIVVCASHQEAFPVSILEAMSSGKPVVSSNVNGIPEAIIDNETGFLVPPKSPIELAKAIKKLLTNPEQRQLMGEKARKRVEENFSREVYTQQIENLYEQL